LVREGLKGGYVDTKFGSVLVRETPPPINTEIIAYKKVIEREVAT
jgi:hypothetical protein